MTRLRLCILIGTCLMLVSSGVLAVWQIASSARPISGSLAELPVIIIDPGHGGPDGGAVGVNGIVEKNINLSVALILRDLFRLNGFRVVMTREEDISIHDPGVIGTRKQKNSDLHNRLAITTEYPNAIFISIHQNKFGDSSSWGTQVFYGPQDSGSKTLAEIVQKNIVEALQPENHRKCKKGEKNLFLVYEAKCPTILVECGFLSNYRDTEILTDEDYQAKLAFVTLRSVIEYLDPITAL